MIYKSSVIEHKIIGFDSDKYIQLQTTKILDRMSKFSGRLYLEIGGHFTRDHHASRVLPGFRLDTKRKIFLQFKDKCEVLFCVNAKRIIENQQYSYDELSYIDQVKTELILIEKVMGHKPHIVINKIDVTDSFDLVVNFEREYQRKGYRVWERYFINGYPNNIEYIFSEEGFGKDDHIPLQKNLILVTGMEANSGKLSTCFGQIFMDKNLGIQSGYAKYETFPIWNLPLEHPVNLAYEAATADIGDKNMIDGYHQKAYKQDVVNYNRDIEAFKLLRYIGRHIVNHKNHINNYKSPTDMGINTAGFAIVDDRVVALAALEEIRRRKLWYDEAQSEHLGAFTTDPVSACEKLEEKAEKYITQFKD